MELFCPFLQFLSDGFLSQKCMEHSLSKRKEVCKMFCFCYCSCVIVVCNQKFLRHTELKGHTNYPFVHKIVKNNGVDRIYEIGFDKFVMRYNKVAPLHFRENFKLIITVNFFYPIEILQQLLVRFRMLHNLQQVSAQVTTTIKTLSVASSFNTNVTAHVTLMTSSPVTGVRDWGTRWNRKAEMLTRQTAYLIVVHGPQISHTE